MSKNARQVLEDVFTERRRPPKPKGSGYSGPGGRMKGQWQGGKPGSGEKKVQPKKDVITEFEGSDDWMLSMVMVALMHANPGMTPDEAVKAGREWARKLQMPRTEHLWNKQRARISRFGIRAEASKIRREMYKLI